jgi:hypothetical protein
VSRELPVPLESWVAAAVAGHGEARAERRAAELRAVLTVLLGTVVLGGLVLAGVIRWHDRDLAAALFFLVLPLGCILAFALLLELERAAAGAAAAARSAAAIARRFPGSPRPVHARPPVRLGRRLLALGLPLLFLGGAALKLGVVCADGWPTCALALLVAAEIGLAALVAWLAVRLWQRAR